ncbi:MAG: T9SS type A sorting domain-containing protein [Bacteroidia bacterium]|nr:T9SS type A sorting domain-containing protein [Bacteroidia bacterium]
MKKIILFVIFYSVLITIKAQNLVPNWSFEDNTQCPNSGGQINLASPWYSPSASTPDYFNQCGTTGYQSLNVWGYQIARTGLAYSSVCVYGSTSSSIRDYIQAQLLDTLIAGENYCVSFYVSHAGMSSFFNTYMPIVISEIGMLFSNNPITSSNYLPFPYTPQIVSPTGTFLSDTLNWMEISGIYTALGGERFITIGNFKDDANTDTLHLIENGLDPQGYYYIDDVSVINCNDTLSSVNEIVNQYDFKLYPNPNNGQMVLEYTLEKNEEAVLNIYDIAGKLISSYLINSNNKSIAINENNLDAGIYYYSISVNGKSVKSDKLVIIK